MVAFFGTYIDTYFQSVYYMRRLLCFYPPIRLSSRPDQIWRHLLPLCSTMFLESKNYTIITVRARTREKDEMENY